MERQESRLAEMDRQELLEHYEKFKKIASKDALTGLLNRGALEKAINKRLKKMTDTECCALFIIDLDNFKAVNDNLGHQTGDQVIMKTACILSGMFRSSDVIGRLGGDEFIVFLKGKVTETLVRAKSQMICDQIQFVLGNNAEIVVTASVGVHLALDGKQEFASLYHSADLALYRAKNGGKQGYCIKKNMDDLEDVGEEHSAPVNAIRLRSLLDHIDSGVAMIEIKDKMEFVYISPALARMIADDEENAADFSVDDLFYPEDRQEIEKLLRENVMEKKQSVSYETHVITKKENPMWWRLYAVQMEYGENQPVILLTITDITDLKEKESSLQMNNDLFQVATSLTSRGIWEVDLEQRTFRLMGANKSFSPELMNTNTFPEELIHKKWIHPESEAGFRDFADEIFSGRMQGYGNFKIRSLTGDLYTWASFSYRMMADDNGRPLRAVGLIEVMSQSIPEGGQTSKGAVLPESLMASLVLQVSANLTRDTVSQCWAEGKDMTGEISAMTCTDILTKEMDRVFLDDRRRHLQKKISRDALLAAYLERKKYWMLYEYRREDSGGDVRWVSCVINLYSDPASQEVHMILWLSSMDKRHQWEMMSGTDIYKDPASGLYTRSTVREISTRILENSRHRLCALVMVEIGGMTRLYASYAGNMDEKWKAVLYSMLLALGAYCVPGQYATDRYMLFFPEITSQDTLKRKLEQIFLFIRSITSDLIDGSMIRFTAAGVCRYQDETEYNILTKKVQTLCQYWANSSGDRVVFADEEKEDMSYRLGESGVSDQIRMPREEIARPLSDREKDTAFHCALRMLEAESLEDSSRCVLETLGEFYEADRTYILVTVEDGNIVTMPYEWTSVKMPSIQQKVSGTMAEKLPLLVRCEKENRPIFLMRQFPPGKQKEDDDEPWQFAVFPMRDEEGIQGYLCIENPKTKVSDAVLPLLLSSCLLKERKKFMRNGAASSASNGIAVFDLPDSNSYIKEMYSFNSDIYSTLGAVCVDIPDFSAINSSRGFEYGRKMLWNVIRKMTGVFGRSMLYRTWDAELVAFCPDATQQIFQEKCAWLQAALNREYPEEIRVGYAWSDKLFSGRDLVDDARRQMQQEFMSRDS